MVPGLTMPEHPPSNNRSFQGHLGLSEFTADLCLPENMHMDAMGSTLVDERILVLQGVVQDSESSRGNLCAGATSSCRRGDGRRASYSDSVPTGLWGHGSPYFPSLDFNVITF